MYTTNIKNIIYMDFDETVRPIDKNMRTYCGIKKLERQLIALNKEHSTVFGWITGGNIDSLLKKAEGYISVFPHFIGSSLGSELHWFDNGTFKPCIDWNARIKKIGFSYDLIDESINALRNKDIQLIKQDDTFQGKYKKSYYLYANSKGNLNNSLEIINTNLAHASIRVVVTKCNPQAGDPENCYDVDFIPSCCGKGKLTRFITNKLGVSYKNTFGFGDSENDLEMLNSVGNPYFVENAESDAKKNRFPITNGLYCMGIYNTLKNTYQL